MESTTKPARKTAIHMKYELGHEVVDIFKTSACMSVLVQHEVHQKKKKKKELCFMEQQRMEVALMHISVLG